MNVYKGKEPCQGCGRSGEEVPRLNKNCLCSECAEALNLGKALVKDRDLKRNYYKIDDIANAHMEWYIIPISNIDRALRDLLKTFSQFDTRNASYKGNPQSRFLAGRADSGTSADNFVLPDVTFDAAKRLTELLKDACWKLKEERENYEQRIEKQCREELRQEKNRIFNDGVNHGRNLLMQLNSGEISVNDFEKPVEKFK